MKANLQPIPTLPLLLACLLCFLPALTRAQTAVEAWAQRYDRPGNANDEATAVAVDRSNNVIVTGGSEVSAGSYVYDCVTIQYSSAGVPLWTNRYDGPGNGDDYSRAIAVDGSNNVIVAGYSTGSSSSRDYVTIKYSSAGAPLWTNRYDGPGNGLDEAYAVAVDGSNNVIVTGYSMGSGSGRDYATVKYSSAGMPLWTNRYDGPGNYDDYARAIVVDGSNNVIVTGWSYGSESAYDYATVKYSSAGAPLWTNRYNGPGNSYDQACAVAVDGGNNVIVTGSSDNGTSYNYLTIQYSSAGAPLWTNRYNGLVNGYDQAYAVAVDGGNNVIVTGSSDNGTNRDYATVKYSSAGVPLWTNRYNGPGNGYDQAYAVAVDGGDNVIVTGDSENGANYDYTTIQYSSGGVPLWTNRYNGPANRSDTARAIAVDGGNNVIVTGNSTGSGGGYDFGTVKYELSPGAPLLSVFRTTTNTVAVSWPSPSAEWTLQQNTNRVNSANWSNVTATIQDNGTTKTLIVNPPIGSRFYRLRKP